MQQEMRRDPRVILLGEDVAGGATIAGFEHDDAWGGVLGVTKGLVQEFGRERVLDTPITDALGPEWQHVSIIGHSLGGAIALAFAGNYLQRVERLVLVDSVGLGPEINQTVLELMRAEPTREHLRSELALFFTRPGQIQQALVDQLYQQRMQPGAHEALEATANAAKRSARYANRFERAGTGCLG